MSKQNDFNKRYREFNSKKSNYQIVQKGDEFFVENLGMGEGGLWHRRTLSHKTVEEAEASIDKQIQDHLDDIDATVVKTFE